MLNTEKIKAILFMSLFCIALTLGDVPVIILRRLDLHPVNILWVRSIVTVLLFFPFLYKDMLKLPNRIWKFVGLQSLCLVFSISLWFWLLKYITLSQLYAVGFLAPIFASLIVVGVLKEV